MTGPEHYAIAEKLALAQSVVHGGQRLVREYPSQDAILLAQVHATLALEVSLREAIWAVAAVIRGQMP